jgi:predicted TIM-barrel fold metal-dependent hydrolase
MKITRRRCLQLVAAGATLPKVDVVGKKKRLTIDTHLEVWTLNSKYPFRHPEPERFRPPTMEAPIENQVAVMEEFGIRYAVLINPRYYGWDNSYIADCRMRYPDRFVAHGLINPLDPKNAEQLEYWVRERGLSGMRLSPIYHPQQTWLNSPENYALWKKAETLGAVFNFYIAPHQMPQLEDMAKRYPKVKIVIDHMGKPDVSEPRPYPNFSKLLPLAKSPNVWVSASEPYEDSKTKEYPYRDTFPFLKMIYEHFGPEKMIWGTGYPRPRWELPMDLELQLVEREIPFYSERDKDLILGRNALKIWKFPKG